MSSPRRRVPRRTHPTSMPTSRQGSRRSKSMTEKPRMTRRTMGSSLSVTRSKPAFVSRLTIRGSTGNGISPGDVGDGYRASGGRRLHDQSRSVSRDLAHCTALRSLVATQLRPGTMIPNSAFPRPPSNPASFPSSNAENLTAACSIQSCN